MAKEKTLDQLSKQLERLEKDFKDITKGWGRYHNNVVRFLGDAKTQLSYIIRDEKIEQAKGKEYFELKDGITPETKLQG